MPILSATSLIKSYRMGEVTVAALDGVDFQVERGEFVAIMGPSGSGKSTLLHLLGGLDTPTAGEVCLAGEAFSALGDDAITRIRRRKVGFIFQFYNLLPTLSAEENVALPLMIDGQGIGKHRARIRALLDMVNLGDRAGHLPDQLSGGQQQRVAIARAFVNNPEIVLADEPTGNLDSRTGASILELLRQACKERQSSVVMVTHDAKAASYADRVVFLRDGKIVDELRANDGAGLPVNQIADLMARLEA